MRVLTRGTSKERGGSQAPTPRHISYRSEHVLDVRRCNARNCRMHQNIQFVCYALFDLQPMQFFQSVRYTVIGPEIRHIMCCCINQSLKWLESRLWQPANTALLKSICDNIRADQWCNQSKRATWATDQQRQCHIKCFINLRAGQPGQCKGQPGQCKGQPGHCPQLPRCSYTTGADTSL